MKIGYFLILTFLFSNIFGCQGIAQNKSQTNQSTNQNVVVAKTNPLKLKLNNEDAGTTDDTSVLSKKLADVFQMREDEGVFRVGTNEIEKTLHFAGDRSVSAEEMAKVFGILSGFRAFPILIPVEVKQAVVRPNPLTLLVYAGSDKYRPFNSGIQTDFIGELSETNNGFPPDKDAISISVDKSGAYSMDGKQFSAIELKTAITNRLKTKAKDKKTITVRAENYGNMEDVATIAKSAGATKVYFVTKNNVHTENGITFSLSPAFINDTEDEQLPEFASIKFKRSNSWTFEITLPNELMTKEKADAEVKEFYEGQKSNNFKDTEVSLLEIDGSTGSLSLTNDEDSSSAGWTGARKKDGKYQFVMIRISCYNESCQDRVNYSRSEFLQILKSIKFN